MISEFGKVTEYLPNMQKKKTKNKAKIIFLQAKQE